MYIRPRQCAAVKNGCSLLLTLWYISFEWTLEWKACALNNSYTPWDILMIFGRHVYQVKTVYRGQEWLPPCCPFELSCLNELYMGKLVHSITHLPFEIFWWYLVYICQAKTMCSVQEWLLPLATFWAISIEWTVSRKASELNNCHHSKFTCSDTQYYLIKYIYQVGSL